MPLLPPRFLQSQVGKREKKEEKREEEGKSLHLPNVGLAESYINRGVCFLLNIQVARLEVEMRGRHKQLLQACCCC